MSNQNESNPPFSSNKDSGQPFEQIKTEDQPNLEQEPIKLQETPESTNRPTSPERVITEPRNQVLSPKSSASGNRRPQSPGVFKGKLDIVRKFLVKEEEKYSHLNAQLSFLQEEKTNLERQWQSEQEQLNMNNLSEKGDEDSDRQLAALRERNRETAHKIEAIKIENKLHLQNNQKQKDLLLQRINLLKVQLEGKERCSQQGKNEGEGQLSELKTQTTLLEEKLISLQRQHQHEQNRKLGVSKAVAELKGVNRELKQEIQGSNQILQAEKQSECSKKILLEKKINQAKERINSKKQELSNLKKGQQIIPHQSSNKIAQQIKEAKQVGSTLTSSIRKIENQIAVKNKESSQAREEEKKKEKRINQLKTKLEGSLRKKEELKSEISKLEAAQEEKPIIKYEEKAPEELVALKSKNEATRKEIKKFNDKIEIEKAEMERLVPPTVIDSMNKKISTIITNNDRLNEVAKIIEEVTKENQRLAQEREQLQWGQNNYLNQLQSDRKKHEERKRLLEEELQLKKKNIQQLHSKLEEYVLAYPDFKPEKKKKPQPEKSKKEIKNKKGPASNVAEQGDRSPSNQSKRKKHNVEHIARTASAVVEDTTEIPKKQEKGGKKKKKGSDSDEIKEEIKQEKASPKISQIHLIPPKVETKRQPVKQEVEGKKKNKKK